MGRPRKRHADEHARLEEWGEWIAKIQAFASRSSTPEGRLHDEGAGAIQSSVPHGSRPVLPDWASLRTPRRIREVDEAINSLHTTLRVLAWAIYVENMKPAEIRRRAGMTDDDYKEQVSALLVTIRICFSKAA
jgi:hypothetical protein